MHLFKLMMFLKYSNIVFLFRTMTEVCIGRSWHKKYPIEHQPQFFKLALFERFFFRDKDTDFWEKCARSAWSVSITFVLTRTKQEKKLNLCKAEITHSYDNFTFLLITLLT